MELFLELFWNFLLVFLLETFKLPSLTMKIRRTFLISWLISINKEKTETSVIDIEHIQTGNKNRVLTLEEANEWMKKAGETKKDTQIKKTN